MTSAENVKPKASAGKYATVGKRGKNVTNALCGKVCGQWITRGKCNQCQARENMQPIANVKNEPKSTEKLAKAKSHLHLA